MARRTKIDSEKTRTSILDAAEILFYDKGVSSTSLCDIAESAGVTRGAIYWHFKNKVDLFEAMHSRVALPIENLHSETLNQPDTLAALRDFWIRSIRQLVENDRRRRVVEILFRKCEYVEEFETASIRIHKWSCAMIEAMTLVFEEAQSKNMLSDDVTPQLAAISTYSFITGLLYSWMLRPDAFDLAGNVSKLITIFFQSLRRPSVPGTPGAA